jgi:hypothetical protein
MFGQVCIPSRKRPLRRPRRICYNNIKIDILEVGWGGIEWIALAQERDSWVLLNAAINLKVQ